MRKHAVRALGCSLLVAGIAGAEPAPAARDLVVGTFEDPPFSMQDEAGHWQGLAIELWREVADTMGVRYEIRGAESQSALFDAIRSGELDLVAAAVPVSSERLTSVEFSTTYLSKVFAIATTPENAGGPLDALRQMLTPRLLYAVSAIAILFVVSSLGIWWIERRRNPDHFGGHPTRGIGEAFWWTAATVTTVGYGDRTPVTLPGRLFAIVVMFAALVLVSIFTGVVASQLTVRQLHGRIHGLADLAQVRVGIVQDSPLAGFLTVRGIRYATFRSVEEALRQLTAGGLDAVVAGEPELHYYAARNFADRIAIVPGAIDQGFLAFVLPPKSPLRIPVDLGLLRVLESPAWPRLRNEYLKR